MSKVPVHQKIFNNLTYYIITFCSYQTVQLVAPAENLQGFVLRCECVLHRSSYSYRISAAITNCIVFDASIDFKNIVFLFINLGKWLVVYSYTMSPFANFKRQAVRNPLGTVSRHEQFETFKTNYLFLKTNKTQLLTKHKI